MARAPIVDAYAEALAPIFGYLAPLFLAGLVLVALIPALPLRTEIEDPAADADARVTGADPSAAPPPVSPDREPDTIRRPGANRS